MIAAVLAVPAFGANTDQEFYDGVYRRGLAAFEAGDYATALGKLRIAAFGFVEDVPRFETAQAYIAATARRLKADDDARTALTRIVAAEKISSQFASLQLPAPIRADLEGAAKDLLPAAQFAMLVPPPTPQISASEPTAPPRTEVVVVPDPVVVKPAKAEPVKSKPRAVPPPAPPQEATPAPPEPQIPPHATLLKLGEASYRARDFRGAVQALQRAGPLEKGEEWYGYYYAVALYETGKYREAKRELAASIAYVKPTPDVERYRALIEGAIEP